MSLGKVQFDAESGPGASNADVGLFDRAIGVKHFVAAQLVAATVEVAAQIGEYDAGQILVLQVEGPPDFVALGGSKIETHGIGIPGLAGAEQ